MTVVSDADGYYTIDVNNPILYPSQIQNADVISVMAVSGALTGWNEGVVDVLDPNAPPFLWLDIVVKGTGPVGHDYTVTLTVTDTIGQTSTMTKLVTVYY